MTQQEFIYYTRQNQCNLESFNMLHFTSTWHVKGERLRLNLMFGPRKKRTTTTLTNEELKKTEKNKR